MGLFCALKACKNRHVKSSKASAVKHHTFPQDDECREKWIAFVNKYNRTTGWTTRPMGSEYLCEDHFEEGSYQPFITRLRHGVVPTKAPRFTAEIARKLNLIPSLHSPLLAKLNDFEHDYDPFASEEALPEGDPADVCIIDSPMTSMGQSEDLNTTLSAHSVCGVHVLKVEPNSENKEKSPPSPSDTVTQLQDASDENQPLLKMDNFDGHPLKRRCTSFDSLKMNTSGPPGFLTPVNRKRKHFIGDLSVSDFRTVEEAEKSLKFVKDRFQTYSHNMHMMRQKLRRYRDKIHSLESQLENLEKK